MLVVSGLAQTGIKTRCFRSSVGKRIERLGVPVLSIVYKKDDYFFADTPMLRELIEKKGGLYLKLLIRMGGEKFNETPL